MLDSLDGISRSRHRLWLADEGTVRLGYGQPVAWTPSLGQESGVVETPDGPRWFSPFPDGSDLWLESDPVAGPMLVELLDHVSQSEV